MDTETIENVKEVIPCHFCNKNKEMTVEVWWRRLHLCETCYFAFKRSWIF